MGTKWERRKGDDEWVSPHDWDQAWKHGAHGILWYATLTVALLAMLTFGFFQIRKRLLPAEEALRRDTYEESKSYLDGTVRDIENIRLQWLTATDSVAKAALAATALHRSADFPEERMPETLRRWVQGLRPPEAP